MITQCILSGDDYHVQLPVEKLNGVEVVYQPEYQDLNSQPAKEFIKRFENEVIF